MLIEGLGGKDPSEKKNLNIRMGREFHQENTKIRIQKLTKFLDASWRKLKIFLALQAIAIFPLAYGLLLRFNMVKVFAPLFLGSDNVLRGESCTGDT